MCITEPYLTPLTREKEFVSAKPRVLGIPSTIPPPFSFAHITNATQLRSPLVFRAPSLLEPPVATEAAAAHSLVMRLLAGMQAPQSESGQSKMGHYAPLPVPHLQLTDCAASIGTPACQRTYTGQSRWYLGQQWTSLPFQSISRGSL